MLDDGGRYAIEVETYMEFVKENYRVATLIDQFDRGLVVPNPEYQRGL